MNLILDWKQYQDAANRVIAEGCVLLENKNNALPLKKGSRVSVFGRIQTSYYKSGTGSGGMVNVAKVYNIVDGLKESGRVEVNETLEKVYAEWEKENPYDEGMGWGQERWSQDEMPLTEQIVQEAAAVSDAAIIIIGRTAGEDKDASDTKGSFRLTDEEEDMLKKVRAGFARVIVLLNVGSIIDMTFVDTYSPDAVMYVWQGGMMGGIGTAMVLTGEAAPSGRLTDTIAYRIEDIPSNANFGSETANIYAEDIYVGYRYFESFAKDKVRYPFGYGISYTDFAISGSFDKACEECKKVFAEAVVKNIGEVAAKEVVQVYVKAPNGALGKPERVLIDFAKTRELGAGEEQKVSFEIPFERFASYDETGVTGYRSAFVLEAGKYEIYIGKNVRDAELVGAFELGETILIRQCEEAMAPVTAFDRMTRDEAGNLVYRPVPLATVNMYERRAQRIPQEIPQTSFKGITLTDVREGEYTIEDFVAQLNDEELACVIRGEGMGSSLVTPGTASAFGGVSKRLQESFGVPAVCCDDGPSGMRLDCGLKAFSLPNGSMVASTFNTALIKELYSFTGLEMVHNKVENLLGPGMNIHRHPLNGRNFEYFSEDPLVTGLMGTAMVAGLKSAGVTGTAKHFCGNNQEFKRHSVDSIISERALREIYLKGFEMLVRSGFGDSIMTTYGRVNGPYTAGNYDLNTTILREDWGFKGIVMTDWWAQIDEPGVEKNKTNFAAMVRAQNDLYMVCPDGSRNASGDNTLEALADGRLTRAELQRSAVNVLSHTMMTRAMDRVMGTAPRIEIVNRPAEEDDFDINDIEFIRLDGEQTVDLSDKECVNGTSIILPLDVQKNGTYEISLTGSSELGELAQLPCTLFYAGIPFVSFTFHGTEGKEATIAKEFAFDKRFSVTRLVVNCSGLKLKEIRFKYINDETGKFHFEV